MFYRPPGRVIRWAPRYSRQRIKRRKEENHTYATRNRNTAFDSSKQPRSDRCTNGVEGMKKNGIISARFVLWSQTILPSRREMSSNNYHQGPMISSRTWHWKASLAKVTYRTITHRVCNWLWKLNELLPHPDCSCGELLNQPISLSASSSQSSVLMKRDNRRGQRNKDTPQTKKLGLGNGENFHTIFQAKSTRKVS